MVLGFQVPLNQAAPETVAHLAGNCVTHSFPARCATVSGAAWLSCTWILKILNIAYVQCDLGYSSGV